MSVSMNFFFELYLYFQSIVQARNGSSVTPSEPSTPIAPTAPPSEIVPHK